MDEKEIWLPVVGYEDCYEVSNLGRVRRTETLRHVKQFQTRRGYQRVTLSRHSKMRGKLVHRLVVTSFMGPIANGLEVNHKNGDKSDNRPSNLEITTRGGNISHSYQVLKSRSARGERNANAKLAPSDVENIRSDYFRGLTQAQIASRFGVGQPHISRIIRGDAWKS